MLNMSSKLIFTSYRLKFLGYIGYQNTSHVLESWQCRMFESRGKGNKRARAKKVVFKVCVGE